MRDLNSDLENHLQSGATTTCTCWIVRRTDQTILGFTDHDHALVIEGITCEAVSGFNPTQAVNELGLSVDNQEIEGAISSDAISDQSLQAGKFDNARVEIWIVNWMNSEERHHLRTALLGEVVREENYFRAELRGLTSLLSEKRGRSYSRHCDAVLGDQKCQVNLDTTARKGVGVVSGVTGRRQILCTGLEAHAKGWFTHGNLTWTGGENSGTSVEISGHGGWQSNELTLWKAMPFAPTVGDSFFVTAGCDKSFATCRTKFANGVNFQGCPHMPGTDFTFGYAADGELHDGSALAK